jgi:hypothetical protein
MREESKPARAMSEAYAVPKSKKWMAFVAVFIVAAVIGGVIFGMKAGGDDDTNRVTAPTNDPPVEKRIELKPADPIPAGSGDVKAVAPDPVAKEGSGSAKAPDEIEMKPDEPTNVAVKPNNTTKPPVVGGRPNPNRNNPNRNNTGKPPVVQTHKDPTGKGSAEAGVGSAKTVPKVDDPPIVPAVKKCSITERLPSGAWPAHCPQAKSQ